MNLSKHLRLLGLLTSAAAFAAFGAPSTALAGKSHFVNPYKVEQHVELEGEDAEYVVSCKGNDIAVDGMWRIDNVDQDNDWEDQDPALAAFWAWPAGSSSIGTSPDLTIRKAIRPMAVYADGTDTAKYHFKFTPLAGADTQIKLFVICVTNPLAPIGGHTHNWQFTTVPAQQTATAPALTQTTDPATAPVTVTATCPAKTIVVEPGFETTSTSNHIVYSRPLPSGPTWTGKQWGWKAWDDGVVAPAVVKYTWRCLDVKSSGPSSGPTHKHSLVFNKKETTWDNTGTPVNPKIGPQQIAERQSHCGEHYKALLGGWDVTANWRAASAGPPAYPAHMWIYFLGMDPRIKTRAFKFLNTDEIPGVVTTAVVCFKDRTT